MKKTAYAKMSDFEDKHWWFVARREIIGSIIKKHNSKKNNQLLEVGCGTGGNFKLLNQYGFVTGLEPSKYAISLVKNEDKGFKILNLNIEDSNADLFDQKYDFILALDVLEHIKEPKRALEKIKEIATNNSNIVITVPAYQFLWGPHDVEHKHYRRYTKKTLKKLLKDQGFEVKKISYMNTFLFPLVMISRLINKLFKKTVVKDSLMPSYFVNSVLKNIFSFERHLLKFINLPFGCSLIAVCQKTSAQNSND